MVSSISTVLASRKSSVKTSAQRQSSLSSRTSVSSSLNSSSYFWDAHLGSVLEDESSWPLLELPSDPDVRAGEGVLTETSSSTFPSVEAKANFCPSPHNSKAFNLVASVVPAPLLKDQVNSAPSVNIVLYLAAFEIILQRFTSQNDIIMGITTKERDTASTEFVDYSGTVIPLRLRTEENPYITLAGMLEKRAGLWKSVIENSIDIPHSVVGNWLGQAGTQTKFQIMVHWNPNQEDDAFISETKGKEQHGQYTLELFITRRHIRLLARKSVWTAHTLQRFLGCYVVLLSSIVIDGPEQFLTETIRSINTLPELHKQFLRSSLVVPSDKCRKMTLMHQFFENTVDSSPNKVALQMMADTMTYRQVEERSNQVAHYLLLVVGVKIEDRVGILLPSGFMQIIALLGILKSGCAYVPLDDSYPAERVKNIIEDSQMVACITSREPMLMSKIKDCRTIFADEIGKGLLSDRPTNVNVSHRNLSYVLYTSGSTGKPKGVEIEHGGVSNMGHGIIPEWPRAEGWQDNFLLTSRLTWDASVLIMIYTFGTGGVMCIVPPEIGNNLGSNFAMLLKEMKITRLACSPGLFQFLDLDKGTMDLRHVEFCGDVLPPNLVKDVQAHGVQVGNLYGPTESTVFVTRCLISTNDPCLSGRKSVAIGNTIPNVRLYLLDDDMNEVPIGVTGELYIAGASLARGYSCEKSNIDAFVSNPFEEECRQELAEGIDVSRLYRSGDLVRLLPEGRLDFVGRVKSSSSYIKLRGYRVELGEISSVLERHEDVSRSVVLVDDPRQKIVAFVRTKTLKKTDEKEEEADIINRLQARLINWCKAHLVDYMVPSSLILVDSIPLDANGKVDRKDLMARLLNSNPEKEIIKPSDPVEEYLVSLFASVSGMKEEQVSVTEDILSYGTTSLTMTHFAAEIRKHGLDKNITVQDLYESPKLRDLSNRVSAQWGDRSKHNRSALRNSLPQHGPNKLDITKLRESRSFKKSVHFCKRHLSDSMNLNHNSDVCYPLTRVQQRMFFAQELNPNSCGYNIPIHLHLMDGVDIKRLEKAFQALMRIHRVLCTKYIGNASSRHECLGFLAMNLADTLKIQVINEAVTESKLTELMFTPFVLADGPCLRPYYFAPSNHLFLVIHHISFDGGCISVLKRHLQELYDDLTWSPAESDLDEYIRFAWEEFGREIEGSPIDSQFWIDHLGLDHPCSLPMFELPQDPNSNSGANSTCVCASVDVSKLKLDSAVAKLSQAKQVSPVIVYISVLEVILKRFSGQEDVVIGCPLNLRPVAYKSTIGMFVNTIALRLKTLYDDESFFELLNRRARLWDEALSHGSIPYDLIAQHVSGRQGAFQVLFNYLNDLLMSDIEGSLFCSKPAENFPKPKRWAEFDLIFSVNNATLEIQVRESIFTQSSAQRLLDCYIELLTVVTNDHSPAISKPWSRVNILPPSQESWLQEHLCGGKNSTSRRCLMHQFFEDSVDSYPEMVALRMMDQEMTYMELEKKSNQIAHLLLTEFDVELNDCIGILLPSGFEQIVSLLGILKAGLAYVPMDESYPRERIRAIIEDSKMVACISTNRDDLFRQVNGHCNILIIEDIRDNLPTSRVVLQKLSRSNLCYVLYTSGSTGKPKGVQIEHQCVSNMVHAILERWPSVEEGKQDNILLSVRLSWDPSVSTMMYSFSTSATMCLIPPHLKADIGPNLPMILRRMQITRLICTPGLLQFLDLSQDLEFVKHIEFGGDTLPTKLVKELSEKEIVVCNAYGPTESTVLVTHHRVSRHDPCLGGREFVSIGSPIPNVRLYVLDKMMNQVPIGVTGELYIAGASLARGYSNKENTLSAFIANPYERQCRKEILEGVDSSRLYRTGDLVRLLPEGSLDFIGRTKSSSTYIKLRGLRIELGEICAALDIHSHAERSIVLIDEHRQQLLAYVQVKKELDRKNHINSSVIESELFQLCRDRLVDYMVPSHIFVLKTLPLDSNDKIDRKALLAIGKDTLSGTKSVAQPLNICEEKLVSILSSFLNINEDNINIDADIFNEFGFNSLMVSQFVSETRRFAFMGELSVRNVYEMPTLRQLAKIIDTDSLFTNEKEPQCMTDPSKNESNFEIDRDSHYPFQATAIKLVALVIDTALIGLILFPPFLFLHSTSIRSNPHVYLLKAYLGIVIFAISLLLVTFIVKVTLIGSIKEGDYKNTSFFAFRWYLFDYLWTSVQRLVLPVLGGSDWLVYIYRLFGANIGKGTIIEHPCIRVPDLVRIGSNSYISSHATLGCVDERQARIFFGSVQLGKHCVVQPRAMLSLRTDIGDFVEVCSLAHITAGTKIASRSRVSGTISRVEQIEHNFFQKAAFRPEQRRYGKYLRLLSPAFVMTFYALALAGFFYIFQFLLWSTGKNEILVATVYVASFPVSAILITFTGASITWVLRRMLLKGRAQDKACHVQSIEFAQRWLAQKLFECSGIFLHEYSVFQRILVRFMGGRIDSVLSPFSPQPMEPDLYISKEGVFGANGVVIRSFVVDVTGIASFASTQIGQNVMILDRSVVLPDTTLADSVVIGSGTVAHGYVPKGSLLVGNPSFEHNRGISLDIETSSCPKLWSAIVQELFLIQPVFMLEKVTTLAVLIVIFLSTPFGVIIHTTMAVIAFMVSSLFLLIIGCATKMLVVGDFRKFGPAEFFTSKIHRWMLVNFVMTATVRPFLERINDFRVTRFILKLLGATIGDNACLSGSVLVLEADFLTVCSGSFVGENATLFGHTFQNGRLELSTIQIGRDCQIGALSVLLPGSDIGDGVVVRPMTQVMPGERLSDYCYYGGSPMEWLSSANPPMGFYGRSHRKDLGYHKFDFPIETAPHLKSRKSLPVCHVSLGDFISFVDFGVPMLDIHYRPLAEDESSFLGDFRLV